MIRSERSRNPANKAQESRSTGLDAISSNIRAITGLSLASQVACFTSPAAANFCF
jgi:hypothetical protein